MTTFSYQVCSLAASALQVSELHPAMSCECCRVFHSIWEMNCPVCPIGAEAVGSQPQGEPCLQLKVSSVCPSSATAGKASVSLLLQQDP